MGRLIDRSFNDFLKNRTVCLVGSSSELRNAEQADKIDAHDVVVRVNAGFPVSEGMVPHIGTKCDIFYMGSVAINIWNKNEELWDVPEKHGISWIVSKYPYKNKKFREFTEKISNVRFRALSEEWRKELSKRIGTHPPSGYIALSDLLCFDFKELYVTGYDFYRAGYYGEYGNSEYGELSPHPSRAPKLVRQKFDLFAQDFVNLFKNDKRITVDEVLQGIIDEYR